MNTILNKGYLKEPVKFINILLYKSVLSNENAY